MGPLAIMTNNRLTVTWCVVIVLAQCLHATSG